MKPKTITGVLVTLFLISTLSMTFNITSVKANASGYLGKYYNLPYPHPDVETPITGVVTGLVENTLPLILTPKGSTYINQFDWYDAKYFSFMRVDSDLEFGGSWFPVDEGKPGDPYYFAVHWEAIITVSSEGDYWFRMASDDDAWLFIDGVLELDNGGIHALAYVNDFVHLTAGDHSLHIYFAERHVVESGFWFEFTTPPGVEVKPPQAPPTVPEFQADPSTITALGAVLYLAIRKLRKQD